MRKLSTMAELVWQLMLLVELAIYLDRLAAGHRPAHRPGRHAAPTVLVMFTDADRVFLAELAELFAAAGAGTAVAS